MVRITQHIEASFTTDRLPTSRVIEYLRDHMEDAIRKAMMEFLHEENIDVGHLTEPAIKWQYDWKEHPPY